MQSFSLRSAPSFARLIFSALVSTLFALILLMLFSLVVYFTGGSNGLLIAVNVVIRLFSAGLAALIFVKTQRGLLCGAIAGAFSGIFVQALFSLISLRFNWGSFVLNSLFCALFGGIFGIIFVNLKNNAKSS